MGRTALIRALCKNVAIHYFGIIFNKCSLGFLCDGPPGTGKTSLVWTAARSTNANRLTLPGYDVHSPYVGDAEALKRQIFARASVSLSPAILFNEIYAIVTNRGCNGAASVRLLSIFLKE